MKVYGPYVRKDGRAYVTFVLAGRKRTQLLSRFRYEQHHGVSLGPDETVDHIDNDLTNDAIENLQVLSRAANAQKAGALRPKEMMTLSCPRCRGEFEREARYVRNNNVKQGKAGPFCSRSCAGAYSADVQNGRA